MAEGCGRGRARGLQRWGQELLWIGRGEQGQEEGGGRGGVTVVIVGRRSRRRGGGERGGGGGGAMLDRDSAAVRGRAKKSRIETRVGQTMQSKVSSRALSAWCYDVGARCRGGSASKKKKKSVSLSLSLSLPSLSLSEFELSGVVSPIAPASYPPPPPCTGRRRLTSAPRQRGPGEKGSTPMPNANASNRSGLPKTRPGHNMARASEQHSAPPQAVAGVNFFFFGAS